MDRNLINITQLDTVQLTNFVSGVAAASFYADLDTMGFVRDSGNETLNGTKVFAGTLAVYGNLVYGNSGDNRFIVNRSGTHFYNGTLSFDPFSGIGYNTDGSPSINYKTRTLYNDWHLDTASETKIYLYNGLYALDIYGNFTNTGAIIFSPFNGYAFASDDLVVPAVNWNNRRLNGAWTSSGGFVARATVENGGSEFDLMSVDTNYKTVSMAYAPTEDQYQVVNIFDSATQTLSDGSQGVPSVKWGQRTLSSYNGNNVMVWGGLFNSALMGRWTLDTLPTQTGDIVNKLYFDSQTGKFLPSGANVVRTTGDQHIAGEKTFDNPVMLNGLQFADNPSYYYSADGYLYSSSDALIAYPGAFNNVGGAPSLDYFSRVLAGSWTISTTPTVGGSIINKTFYDANTVGLTGAQTVLGLKTFTTGPRFGDQVTNTTAPVLSQWYNGAAMDFYLIASNAGTNIAGDNSKGWTWGATQNDSLRFAINNGVVMKMTSAGGVLSGRWKNEANYNKQSSLDVGTSITINWISGNVFDKTLTASTSFAFSNDIDGQTIDLVTMSTGSYTVSFPTGVKWPGGVPFLGTVGTVGVPAYDLWTFRKINGRIFGQYSPNHI